MYPLLALSSNVVILEMVFGKAVMAPNIQIVENRCRKARQAGGVHLTRGESRGGADGTTICQICGRCASQPSWRSFLSHCVVDTLYTPRCRDLKHAQAHFVRAQKLKKGNNNLGAESETVVLNMLVG